MKPKKKKKYEKPRITKIMLDAECAVLGFCKTSGSGGPSAANCAVGAAVCSTAGS
jgi:hypothetical protein